MKTTVSRVPILAGQILTGAAKNPVIARSAKVMSFNTGMSRDRDGEFCPLTCDDRLTRARENMLAQPVETSLYGVGEQRIFPIEGIEIDFLPILFGQFAKRCRK